jgi:predicted nucleic acid-binding protein
MDEEYSQKAINLLKKYVSNELDILAPSLLEYEVINGLLVAKKRGGIQEEKILSAIDGFISLKIKLKNLSLFYPKVLYYYKIYNRSVYDASYLAMADEESISLVTADERLYNMVRKDLKWLGDIQ